MLTMHQADFQININFRLCVSWRRHWRRVTDSLPEGPLRHHGQGIHYSTHHHASGTLFSSFLHSSHTESWINQSMRTMWRRDNVTVKTTFQFGRILTPLSQVLHNAFPRFAERGEGGGYQQQDANECWMEILRMLQVHMIIWNLDYLPNVEWAKMSCCSKRHLLQSSPPGPMLWSSSWASSAQQRQSEITFQLFDMLCFYMIFTRSYFSPGA